MYIHQVYHFLDQYMCTAGLVSPPFFQTWLRDPAFLIKTATSRKEGLTPAEQLLAARRIVAMVSEAAAAAQADADISTVLRRITSEQRQQAYTNARKYLQGEEAARRHYQFNIDGFKHRFVAGEFDTVVHGCTNPAKTGRYWPWFKKAQEEHESKVAEAAATQAAAAAASAAEAAARAQAEAEEELARKAEAMSEAERQQYMANRGIMEKLQEAHRQQVNHVWQRRSAMLEKLHGDAEEILDMRRERQSTEESQQICPVHLMPMKRKAGLADTRWDTILPPAVPKLVVLDLAIAGSITPACMDMALRLASSSGTRRQASTHVGLDTVTPAPVMCSAMAPQDRPRPGGAAAVAPAVVPSEGGAVSSPPGTINHVRGRGGDGAGGSGFSLAPSWQARCSYWLCPRIGLQARCWQQESKRRLRSWTLPLPVCSRSSSRAMTARRAG